MTDLDTGSSSIRDDSICESSLPPNKSSGDIVERLLDRSDHYLPDWADATMKDAAAEIERLRREVGDLPILRDAICRIHNREWADGDPLAHVSHAAAMWKIADDTIREIGNPGATSTNEVKRLQALVSQSEAERYKSCGELLKRALTAESAVAAAWEALDLIRAAVSKKTAESGDSPSTHNSESE